MKKTKNKKHLNLSFFISLFMFLATLMTLLFARMEMKRKSYEIYKLSSEFKVLEDEYRSLYTDYSSRVSDKNITRVAEATLSVQTPHFNQIISLGSQSFLISSK